MPKSFAPIIEKDTRILIIGTMPGEESLRCQEYYAHKQNKFWIIMSDVFNDGQDWTSYSQKLDTLRTNKVGLWDALKTCNRSGSLDADIKDAIPNNFKKYRYISKFLFNGKKAFEYFKRYNGELLQENNYVILPSTSPANAAIKYNDKLTIWKKNLLE